MKTTVDVHTELKSLTGTFKCRTITVRKRYPGSVFESQEVFEVVNYYGFGLIPVKTLVKLFRAFKQTRVKAVTIEPKDDGILIGFNRATYFLKGFKEWPGPTTKGAPSADLIRVGEISVLRAKGKTCRKP